MPLSTPGQRAKWRVDRAVKSGKAINPADLELMKLEEMEIPANLNQEEIAKAKVPPPSPLQQSDPQAPIPLRVNQNEQQSQLNGTVPSLKDTVTGVNSQQPRKLTKRERAHADFWASDFGKLCVLVLWFVLADLDKASFYAPSPDECKAASVPMARISARASEYANVPEWMGDAFLTAVDMSDLGFAITGYLERIGVLTKMQNYYSGVASRARKGNGSVGPNVNNGEVSNGYVDLGKLGIGEQYRPI